MLRLHDGLYAHQKTAPALSEIRSLDGTVSVPVAPEHARDLAALAQGLPDDAAVSDAILEAIAAGLASRGLPPVDPVVEQRLAELGRGFAWTLPDDARANDLVGLIRRAHARRKLFVHDFGQTPCLPESGAARCLALAHALGRTDARVFVIGDDDLLSLGLAFLGFTVTSIDIDPAVIAFVADVARDEGLTLDARVYDVLAPMDEALVGAYDAVFTDPMSYEKCQVAFLSRALAVVKPGGRVLSCVHPIARHTFARVHGALPATVESYRYHFSAYTYYDYTENTYRSDLVTLVREDGPLPFAPDDTIPFEHLTEGFLSDGFHGLGDIYGMRLGARKALTIDEIAALVRGAGHDIVAVQGGQVGQKVHACCATREGGHVVVTVDLKRARIAVDVWPYEDERDTSLLALLAPLVRGVRTSLWYTDAPQLPARVVDVSSGEG